MGTLHLDFLSSFAKFELWLGKICGECGGAYVMLSRGLSTCGIFGGCPQCRDRLPNFKIRNGGSVLQCEWRVSCREADYIPAILTLKSYVEGIVRGYRNGLLTSQNYSSLTQCDNIDGLLSLPRRRLQKLF